MKVSPSNDGVLLTFFTLGLGVVGGAIHNQVRGGRGSGARTTYRPGTRVRVSEGSGTDSNRMGQIADWSEVRFRYDGVPSNIQGAYSPPDRRIEVPVRMDDGRLILMFKDRLSRV